MPSPTDNAHPHQGMPVLRLGSELPQARRALILLHGRGASAQDMAGLAQELALPDDMLVLAPQASGNIWYPQRLTATVESNEPYLSSALLRVSEVVATLAEGGISAEKVWLGGFSQGASLAIEFVLRSARRWGGLLAFSGGFIWPLGKPRPAAGSVQGTPVFLGCSDVDPYIPRSRVEETAAILEAMGAHVTQRLYPGMGHTINQDEIQWAQKLISGTNTSQT
jgi:predicted esterase